MKNFSERFHFLQSLLIRDKRFENHSIEHCMDWLKFNRDKVEVKIEKIPFHGLKDWHFCDLGNLQHRSGKFFSIEGVRVKTDFRVKETWDQPIINQPEIGILGILTKKINGVLHFLMQAKIEPGNINFVQLSPTLQATKSNYTQVHGGNLPAYIEYFTKRNDKNVRTLVDQLQSEQGSRFLKKRNRNIIIEVFDEIEVLENFIWLTLAQIKELLRYDNIVNMDTRTVISSIIYEGFQDDNLFRNSTAAMDFSRPMLLSALDLSNSYLQFDELISWFTGLKTKYELDVNRIPLKNVQGWLKNDFEIYHHEKKYFKVIAVNVHISNREVKSWSQPIIESVQEGIIGFIAKKINGIYHFLVQAKVEAGNFDILEIAPTVQCLTGNYRKGLNEYDVPFLDLFLDERKAKVLHKSLQSEEGGRFYREQNLNIIIEVSDSFSVSEIPDNYTWMTLRQLMEFTRYNNYLNIQARSLLSVISFKNN